MKLKWVNDSNSTDELIKFVKVANLVHSSGFVFGIYYTVQCGQILNAGIEINSPLFGLDVFSKIYLIDKYFFIIYICIWE